MTDLVRTELAVANGDSNNQVQAPVVLSYVIPTRNELGGIEALLARLVDCTNVPAEVVFVDDSDDATPYSVQRLSKAGAAGDLTIRLVHRTQSKRAGGLGTAVCEGIRVATGLYVCVLDADLQHPPELVTELMAAAVATNADLVVGSRYADGGVDRGLTTSRRIVSRSCAKAAKVAFPRRLKGVTDPLSGFFLVRREAIDPDLLHPHGFKILMEILGRFPKLKVTEVGFVFSERYAGMSKASMREGLRYGRQLGGLRAAAWNPRKPSTKVFNYNIHDIISVQADSLLPELEKFRVRTLAGDPTIKVHMKRFDSREAGELILLADTKPRIRYDELFGRRGFVVEVEVGEHQAKVWASPSICRSPHVLYTNVVEPLLRWHFVNRGYALVHAACFTDGNDAHLVTARTDTGKTTTMLKILEKGEYHFVSDDLTLITPEGTVLPYPKPLTISNHTVHALRSAELNRTQRLTLPLQSRLHSKGGREFALYMASLGLPVATLNSFTQRVIPPPKYHVEQLVPGVRTAPTAQVASLSIIQRGEDDIEPLDPDKAITLLLENCEDAYGFPPYSALESLVFTTSDDDLRFKEREIIRRALQGTPATLYTSSNMGWAETIHSALVATRNTSVGKQPHPIT